MLTTLVIGLREGLEAALIVGIIAAFLRRHGQSLRAMWVGVAAAVALSLGVGTTLEIISASLPQAQQEGMETIIGAIAVVMVTGMILWMAKNARNLKSELESSAATALGSGSATALAVMAFLAVLREGIETAVFLLAAFQSSVDPLFAGLGTVIGVGISVVIGYGIYRGGVRLNMGKFFKITGVFLVLVAAGLVLKSLRTAHEAGWLTLGQARTVDLSWLAPNGSPQTALLTGVLGIPADPRLIEVIAWALYLIPMLLFVLWPLSLRPRGAQLPRFFAWTAASVAGLALVIASAAAIFAPLTPQWGTTPVTSDGGQAGELSLTAASATSVSLKLSQGGQPRDFSASAVASDTERRGVAADQYHAGLPSPSGLPSELSIAEVQALSGGRLPVGINPETNPGPFKAQWQSDAILNVWLAQGQILDAEQSSSLAVRLSGGGLSSSRALGVTAQALKTSGLAPSSTVSSSWAVEPALAEQHAAELKDFQDADHESALYRWVLPGTLLLIALAFAAKFWQVRRQNKVNQLKVTQNKQKEPAGSQSSSPVSVTEENKTPENIETTEQAATTHT